MEELPPRGATFKIDGGRSLVMGELPLRGAA